LSWRWGRGWGFGVGPVVVEGVSVAVKGWFESRVGFENTVKKRGWSFFNRLKRVGLRSRGGEMVTCVLCSRWRKLPHVVSYSG